MALLSSYTPDNRVVTKEKQVQFSWEVVKGWWTVDSTVGTLFSEDHAIDIFRRCTMDYSYVGMDEQTALSCADALQNLFTRSCKTSIWTGEMPSVGNPDFTDIASVSSIMADVKCVHVDGDMWQVDVSVNEEDERMRMPFTIGYPDIATVSALFNDENQRKYFLEET